MMTSSESYIALCGGFTSNNTTTTTIGAALYSNDFTLQW